MCVIEDVELVAPLLDPLWLSRIAVPSTSSVTGVSAAAPTGRMSAARAAARRSGFRIVPPRWAREGRDGGPPSRTSLLRCPRAVVVVGSADVGLFRVTERDTQAGRPVLAADPVDRERRDRVQPRALLDPEAAQTDGHRDRAGVREVRLRTRNA